MIRILVAEDNNIMRNEIVRLLDGQQDISVVAQAWNGEEALKLLKENLAPDVLLTDLNMPGMDGIELTAKVVGLFSSVKVVILTGNEQTIYKEQAFRCGASAYLTKDVTSTDLINTIRKAAHNEI